MPWVSAVQRRARSLNMGQDGMKRFFRQDFETLDPVRSGFERPKRIQRRLGAGEAEPRDSSRVKSRKQPQSGRSDDS